jgi:hypothetical protein
MRQATSDDIPRIVDMCREFHAASGLPMEFDPAGMASFAARMIESPDMVIIVSDDGLIGGLLMPAYCAPNWKIAGELFWWAKGSGLQLLSAFEQWGRDNGANEVRMTTLSALQRADAILLARGYANVETSYTKVI